MLNDILIGCIADDDSDLSEEEQMQIVYQELSEEDDDFLRGFAAMCGEKVLELNKAYNIIMDIKQIALTILEGRKEEPDGKD